MNRKYIIGISLLVAFLFAASAVSAASSSASEEILDASDYNDHDYGVLTTDLWECYLLFSAPGGYSSDDAIYGEDTTATDAFPNGPELTLDAPNPSNPPAPFIDSYFMAGYPLTSPYYKMRADIKQGPAAYKVWDLYVTLDPDTGPLVTMTWSYDATTEYGHIDLYDSTGTTWLADLLPTAGVYTFTSTGTDHFQIIAYASGQDCTDPVTVNVPGDLDYYHMGTTCGMVDDYSSTCLGGYDGGEDIIYEITVMAYTVVDIVCDPSCGTASWLGMAIDTVCPPGDPCMAYDTASSGSVSILGLTLFPGTYYLMIDTYPSPDCIDCYELTITDVTPAFAEFEKSILTGWETLPPICDYEICLYDSYGDGWDGAYIDVLVNGVVVLDDITCAASLDCFTFPVSNGDEITTDYTPGNYESEHSYEIFDSFGASVWYEGPGYPGNVPPLTLYAFCPSGMVPILVDYVDATICTNVTFYLEVTNPGPGFIWLWVIEDILPPCVEYNFDPANGHQAWVSIDGGPPIPWEPDVFAPPFIAWTAIIPADYWYPGSLPGELPPGASIAIWFDCHVIGPACIENINEAWVEGESELGGYFFYGDTAIVHPITTDDVGVTAILSPTGTNLLPGDYTVEVEVTNFASTDAIDVPVTAYIYNCSEKPPANDDLPWLEDFETIGVGDWTIVDSNGNGCMWYPSSTDYTPAGNLGGASGTWMLMDDDACGSSSNNPWEELISPVIDCRIHTAITLDFDGDFEDMAGYGEFYVFVSNDGSTWNQVFFETLDVDPDGWNNHPGLPIDISTYADAQPTVQIKFVYTDLNPTGTNGYAWGTHVDNIFVDGVPTSSSKTDCDYEPDTLQYTLNGIIPLIPGFSSVNYVFTPDVYLWYDPVDWFENFFIEACTYQPADTDNSNDCWNQSCCDLRVINPRVWNCEQDIWYSYIQDAVDDSNPTEHLQCIDDTFPENVVIDDTHWGITIMPYEDASPILDGMGETGFLLDVLSDGCTIFNFEIMNCSFGIYLNDSWDDSILNNSIHDNGIGIAIADPWQAHHYYINYNTFEDNLEDIINYAPSTAPPPKDDRGKDTKAQLWFEGFESGVVPPAGWTLEQHSVPTNPYTWEVGGPYEGSFGAVCYYDPTYTSTQDEWLISHSFSLAGYSNAELSFAWMSSYYWGYDPYDNYDIEVWASGDGGSNWDLLWVEDSEAPWTTWEWYPETLSLAAYDGLSDVKVAFVYFGYDGAQAGIDAVEVNADVGQLWDLTVNIVGSGTVVESPMYKTLYPDGTTVELTAVPDVDWIFDHWEDDLTGNANPEYILMDSDHTVTAVFIEGVECDEGIPEGCHGIHCNDFMSYYPDIAIDNRDDAVTLDATCNWFGGPDGPSGDDYDGMGGQVLGPVDVIPWIGISADMIVVDGVTEIEICEVLTFDGCGSFAANGCIECGCELTDIYEYRWEFGDGFFQIGDDCMASHEFCEPGVFDVCLRIAAIIEIDGVEMMFYDWHCVTITVNDPAMPLGCNAGGGGLGGYECNRAEQIQLKGTAYGGTLPYSYAWDFGDGSSGSGNNPTHTYMEKGTYTVTLTVTDSAADTATDTATVTVYGPDELIANAGGPYHEMADENVNFLGSATGGVEPYGYTWDFGDGTTGYGQVTVHKYDEGTYTATLTVTDSEGNSDEHTSTVTIVEDHGVVEIRDIKGGLGVKATIVTGDSSVDWTIDVDGRYIILGGHASGTTAANKAETVRIPFSLGFGDVDITITAGTLVEERNGFMLGPFVILK